MESSGLVYMIRNNQLNNLGLLFSMFTRREDSFEKLRKCLSEFIIEEGNKLVRDEQIKNEDFVSQLISLRDRIVEISTKAMKRDPQIELSIKLAFEEVVNQNNRTAKALVLYLDEMFKKDFKTTSELELNELLDKIIHIFRYLLDKDVFEGFYKNSFAKRLLENRHNNEDAERALVLKLKEECGFQFTQKLEVMFKDIKVSEELTTEFKTKPSC
jgi:cullin 3